MRAERGWLADQLARVLMLLVALGVGGYLAFQWWMEPPSAQAELQQANPGWTVEKPRYRGLRLADGRGEDLFINGDDAGPLRLQRLDCAQLAPSLPSWLRLPTGRTGGCLQLGNAAPFTLVLNHRTPMPITELWERHYAPHLDELELPYWGGSSSRGTDGPASTTPGRGQHVMSYSVDPAHGSTGPRVNLMAFYLGDDTVLVVTLRPSAPP
jgi:hypothetical protein